VQTYDQIQRAFPGAQTPAQVVVKAPDVNSPQVRSAIATLRRDALASGVMQKPIQTFVNPAHTVARVAIPLAGDGEDARSVYALSVLRDRVIPASLGGVAGVETAVTGETAGTHGVPTREAVGREIHTTASTVTSAAAVMVAVFTIFASLSTIDIKQLGVGLAVAVLIDATVIRGVLLPAVMTLLGERNWYLPRWLAWMPRLNVESRRGDHRPRGELAPALD
jgi:uncharacterized membrane protein YdfJ with MMPL/SSD domain